MEIRNVSLVNARTKVINCMVQNVSVDITINQVSPAGEYCGHLDVAGGCR
jgi:hypothetical protein